MKKAIVVWVIVLVLAGVYIGSQTYIDRLATEPVISEEVPVKADDGIVTLSVTAVGDCTLGDDISLPGVSFGNEVKNQKNNYSYFFENVKQYFEADDLTIINFEGVLSDRGIREQKQYAFKGNPEYVNILTEASIEAATLANNHSLDYGSAAFEDTRKLLFGSEITGFGMDDYEIRDIDGIKVGLIGTNALNYAGRTEFPKIIENLKAESPELIIANFHWGTELATEPDGIQVELAHKAIDSGADLVIGHHPHVLQGIEKYKGKYIVYSLGNFCFGGNTNPADKDTMIFNQVFTFEKGRLTDEEEVSVIPCSISSVNNRNNYQPTPVEGDEFKRVKDKIINRSEKFEGIDSIDFIRG